MYNYTAILIDMGSEETLNAAPETETTAPRSLAQNKLYQSFVDVLSGWLYYTPTYAIQELASGKEFDTVAKTRLIGMAAHAIAMRPIGLLRNYVARKWGVTPESPIVDKMKVNLVAVAPIQAVVYAGMLVGGMMWSGESENVRNAVDQFFQTMDPAQLTGNKTIMSSAYAWALGVGLSIPHSIPYGYFQDRVRGTMGIKPAIARAETATVPSSTDVA